MNGVDRRSNKAWAPAAEADAEYASECARRPTRAPVNEDVFLLATDLDTELTEEDLATRSIARSIIAHPRQSKQRRFCRDGHGEKWRVEQETVFSSNVTT